ncbi:MAG: hypothetical protein ABIJ41_04610 [Candidatus Omnitrophota bacterium]
MKRLFSSGSQQGATVAAFVMIVFLALIVFALVFINRRINKSFDKDNPSQSVRAQVKSDPQKESFSIRTQPSLSFQQDNDENYRTTAKKKDLKDEKERKTDPNEIIFEPSIKSHLLIQ